MRGHNLTFEGGIFIASHGRERTQLMVPEYEPGDPRTKMHIPSDLAGLTYNPYRWVDGDPTATGLPRAARTVCDRLGPGPPRRGDAAHAARPSRGRRPRAGGPPAPPGDARPRCGVRAVRWRRPRLGARSGGARHAVRPDPPPGGLSDLEDSIRRVVAMRTWGVTAGAKRLGLKHSSLSQWARGRKRRLCT